MTLKQPLIIASNNKFKTQELIECFNYCGYMAISYLKMMNRVKFPDEGTNDYQENAIQKAEYIHQFLPNELVVADDSGMLLDAFPNEFGVTTARDLSEYRDVDHLNQHIIEIVVGHDRGVTMLSYLALVGLPRTEIGIGQFKGTIADRELGDNGTSFDLILTDSTSGKTLAELPDSKKLPLLHRTKAIQNLMDRIGE